MRSLLLLIAVLVSTPVLGQRVIAFAAQGSGSFWPLGYPVPVPVASLEPIEGFREYQSLMAQLQGLALESADLRAVAVGTTHAQRSIWAFVVSSASDLDREGLAKPAFYLNGTTHAREWGIPEVAAGTIEHLLAGADRSGVERYLLDNTRLVIVPVQNVDGFLQTQRYPSQAIIESDPRFPSHWLRDGRMRRKNMAEVDEDLFSFADHLGGVDLNRNNRPFWASSSQSSSNPADLVYHGSAAQSEPEVQAMLQALSLAPTSRLRLGIDLHSYTQVFFSSNTGDSELFAIQNQLIDRLASHHQQVSRSERFPGGRLYRNVPDPAFQGIGAHAEYFAYEFAVPAWTLEIEPGDGAGQDYGGTGDSHSGFILPDSEARRVADAWAQSHQVAFYFMAGPPHLAATEIDALVGAQAEPRLRTRWALEGGVRTLDVSTLQALAPGQTYRARLRFSKPMRVHDADGTAQGFPGILVAPPIVSLLREGQRSSLDTSGGRWLTRAMGAGRYDGDTFEFEFTLAADASLGEARLAVEAQDLVGLRLDPQPESPVDWSQGRWQGYEGQPGGEDISVALLLGGLGLEVVEHDTVVSEGSVVRVRLRRNAPADEALHAALCDPRLEDVVPDCAALVGRWAAGERGEMVLQLPLLDDLELQGDRRVQLPVFAWSSLSQVTKVAEIAVDVLDNDRPGQRRLRVAAGQSLDLVLAQVHAASAGLLEPVDVVLNAGGSYTVGDTADLQGLPMAGEILGRVRVFANGAEILAGTARQLGGGSLFTILEGAELELYDARFRSADPQAGIRLDSVFRNHGRIVLQRGKIDAVRATDLLDNRGHAELSGLWLDALDLSGAVLRNAGEAEWRNSTVSGSRGALVNGLSGLAVLDAISAVDVDSNGPLLMGPLQIGNSLLASYRILDAGGLPSAEPACASGATSLGFNRVGTDCAFFSEGDQRTDHRPAEWLVLDHERGALPPPPPAIDAIPQQRCSPTDQLGSPRPQSSTQNARCDIGALESGIAPFRGFWIPDRPGHGVDLQVRGDRLFIAWYTYLSDGSPTMYSAIAPLQGPLWRASLLGNRRDPGSGAIENFTVGEVEIAFQSDTRAQLRWRFDEGNLQGEEGIRAYLFDHALPAVEITGTWYPPSDSGWGASIASQGEQTGVVAYYYDVMGTLRWALGIAEAGDVVDVPVLHFTGFCPNCDSETNPVQTTPAGTVRVQMLSPEHLEVSTDLVYPVAPGGSWQRQGASFQPLNGPVDNRRLRRQLLDLDE